MRLKSKDLKKRADMLMKESQKLRDQARELYDQVGVADKELRYNSIIYDIESIIQDLQEEIQTVFYSTLHANDGIAISTEVQQKSLVARILQTVHEVMDNNSKFYPKGTSFEGSFDGEYYIPDNFCQYFNLPDSFLKNK